MKVFIYSKRFKEEYIPYLNELFDTLSRESLDVVLNDTLYDALQGLDHKVSQYPRCQSHTELVDHNVDYVITLGGDGTILSAILLIRDLGIPILGINLGRLGFLASTEKSYIKEAIQKLKTKDFTLNKRSLLALDSDIPLFGESRFALNDFTILKRDTSSMITIHTYINGDYLNSYWADGLIVATPTGSTGYSLSCGGPIVFPNSGNFVITPVAPHNLTVRPIVISDTSEISFQVEGRSDNFLCTLDSRFETVATEHALSLKKCDFGVNLIQLDTSTFLKTIQDKLTWGKDKRN